MGRLLVDALQGMTVIGTLGAVAYGGTIVWGTATLHAIPGDMYGSLVGAMLLAATGATSLMCLARYRLSQ